MKARITCINKSHGHHDNPHEAVSRYGWVLDGTGEKGTSERQAMVEWVKNGNMAYVKDDKGNVAYCAVRTSSNGTEFLQTYADNVYTDNLLSLNECPV